VRDTGKVLAGIRGVSLWLVASWIYDRCPNCPPQHNPGCHRRRRDGHDWIVLSSRACSRAVGTTPRQVRRSLTKLIELGLVDRYTESESPHDAEGRYVEDDGWHGPKTLLVRVKLLLPLE